MAADMPDRTHSDNEDRFIILGESLYHRLLVVVYTEINDDFRIISARAATRSERKMYETGTE